MPTIKCKSCETLKPHMAKGLCRSCYLRRWRKDLSAEDRRAADRYKRRWYKKDSKRNPGKYRRWREERNHGGSRQQVLARDNHTCVMCHKRKKPRQLIAHHKDMTGRKQKKRLHGVQHEITVCRSCHVGIHRRNLERSRFGVKHQGWSCRHKKCAGCGTTERRHYGQGLCLRCWARGYYHRVGKAKRLQRRMKIQSNLHGDMQRPEAKRV